MAYTNVNQPQKQGGFFSNLANPVIRKLEKNGEYQASTTATYGGIIGKTVFFILMTVIGALVCFIIHNILAAADPASLVTYTDAKNNILSFTAHPIEFVIWFIAAIVTLFVPFLAWALFKTIPVTGSIYCVAQGIVIGAITNALAPDYKFISVLAMLITLALVGGMLLVYAKGIIKVTARFRGVLTAVFFAIIVAGVLYTILTFIPPVRNFIYGSAIGQTLTNPVFSIIVAIVYVIIAALFMLADFDTIQKCVENKVDKKYEWMAAWGLAYTVIYIYFKILRILIMIFGNSKNSSKSGNKF